MSTEKFDPPVPLAALPRITFLHHPEPHPAEEMCGDLLSLAKPGTVRMRVLTGRDADYWSDK